MARAESRRKDKCSTARRRETYPFESGAMATAVEYAATVGHSIAHTVTFTRYDRRVEVSPHHLSGVPTALLHDLVFLGACVTQNPISFEDHHRWYIFLTNRGIDPDRVTEYATARISTQHAWRTFVYRMYLRSDKERAAKRVCGRGRECKVEMLGLGDGSVVGRIASYLELESNESPIAWKVLRQVVEMAPRFRWEMHRSHLEEEEEEEERRVAEEARCYDWDV